jgi:Pyridoxamine 5'-phosphate oxidase
MARGMSPDERRAFLTNGTRTAILATSRPDGSPHAVPVGFVLDGVVPFADDALRLFVRVKPTRILVLDAVGKH